LWPRCPLDYKERSGSAEHVMKMKGIVQVVGGVLLVVAIVAAVALGRAGPSALGLVTIGGYWILRGYLELRP